MLLRRKQNPLGEARAVRSIPVGAARLRRDEDPNSLSQLEAPRVDEAEAAGTGRDTISHVDFLARVARGTSFAMDEAQLLSVAERAVAKLVPNGSSTWLVASDDDRLEVRFTLGDTPTHCGVSLGWTCPVVTTGQAQLFDDSTEIDACPHLASYPDPCASACIPVTARDAPIEVVHIVSPVEEAVDISTMSLLDATLAMVASRLTVINENAGLPATSCRRRRHRHRHH